VGGARDWTDRKNTHSKWMGFDACLAIFRCLLTPSTVYPRSLL
jgi:hypothetical protein